MTEHDVPHDTEIRSATVLPARRTDVELVTDDHLTLVGELAEPADTPARGTIVTLHPLPTAHGFMDSHVLKKAAVGCCAAPEQPISTSCWPGCVPRHRRGCRRRRRCS
jgi:hypothetical protein